MKKSVSILTLCLAAACDRTPALTDPYKDIELKSPPAKVTTERNKGAFAEGAALSMGRCASTPRTS